ncbi:hypothetical protein R6Z07F_002818 [Ovis aries]
MRLELLILSSRPPRPPASTVTPQAADTCQAANSYHFLITYFEPGTVRNARSQLRGLTVLHNRFQPVNQIDFYKPPCRPQPSEIKSSFSHKVQFKSFLALLISAFMCVANNDGAPRNK